MARTKYGYAESSDIKATNAGHIYNIVNESGAIENGTLWTKGDVAFTQDEEVYKVTAPTKGGKVILALSSLYSYDTSTTLGQHEMYLRKEAGEVARGYELVEGDRYAIADYMVTTLAGSGKPAVAKNLLVADTSKNTYTEVAAATEVDDYGFVARSNSIVYRSNLTLYNNEVIKNIDVPADTGGVGG